MGSRGPAQETTPAAGREPIPRAGVRGLIGWPLSEGLLLRAVAAVFGTWTALTLAYLAGLEGLYDLRYALSLLPPGGRALTTGLVTTLALMAVVIPIGFSLGFTFGWARTSHSWFPRALAATYVEFFRGMPPIVLIAFAFLITIVILRGNDRVDVFPFATSVSVLALAAHSGAYQAEIVRAGILSVPATQIEAGESIGLSRSTILTRITLPQMFRVSLPALGNELAWMVHIEPSVPMVMASSIGMTSAPRDSPTITRSGLQRSAQRTSSAMGMAPSPSTLGSRSWNGTTWGWRSVKR